MHNLDHQQIASELRGNRQRASIKASDIEAAKHTHAAAVQRAAARKAPSPDYSAV